jgi:L-fucose dehydrogenase
MELGLKGKVILVTSGAKGIGAAIVRGCAAEGAIAVFLDRDEPAGEKLLADLRTEGARTAFLAGEITEEGTCAKSVELTAEKFGRIDALVNTAGVNDGVSLEYGSSEEFLASLLLNLTHYYSMAHYALPALKKARGSIVNISSKTGATGRGGKSGSAAAEAAILGLTREWAVELLPAGIRVNAVVAAELATPSYQQRVSGFPNPEEKMARIRSKIPPGKSMTRTEETAGTVMFLISERASHITGQHVYVDAGYADRAPT